MTIGREAARTAQRGAVTISSFLLGLVAAPLPARWRRRLPVMESSAFEAASIFSGFLQALGALTIFVLGYLAWIHHQYDLIDARALAAGDRGAWNSEEQQVLGRALLLGNPILPIIFMFTSWSGFLPIVFLAGGAIRMIHGAITKEVMPDPVLGLLDLGIATLLRKKRVTDRERSKDASPDRLYVGGPSDGWALCLDTATDFAWNVGNTVIVAGEQYRLKAKREDRTPTGLRLRYELETMPHGIAIRGLRRYEPKDPPIVMSGVQP